MKYKMVQSLLKHLKEVCVKVLNMDDLIQSLILLEWRDWPWPLDLQLY